MAYNYTINGCSDLGGVSRVAYPSSFKDEVESFNPIPRIAYLNGTKGSRSRIIAINYSNIRDPQSDTKFDKFDNAFEFGKDNIYYAVGGVGPLSDLKYIVAVNYDTSFDKICATSVTNPITLRLIFTENISSIKAGDTYILQIGTLPNGKFIMGTKAIRSTTPFISNTNDTNNTSNKYIVTGCQRENSWEKDTAFIPNYNYEGDVNVIAVNYRPDITIKNVPTDGFEKYEIVIKETGSPYGPREYGFTYKIDVSRWETIRNSRITYNYGSETIIAVNELRESKPEKICNKIIDKESIFVSIRVIVTNKTGILRVGDIIIIRVARLEDGKDLIASSEISRLKNHVDKFVI